MYYTYVKNKQTIIEFSSTLMNQLSQEAGREIKHLEEIVEATTKISKAFIISIDSVSLENKGLINYLITTLKQHVNLTLIRIASVDGTYVAVLKSNNNEEISENKNLNNSYFTIIYGNQVDEGKQIIIKEDEAGIKNERKDISKKYDPRKRVWFKEIIGNKNGKWTEVYYSIVAKSLGISFGYPIYDASNQLIAISSSSVDLSYLSQYLHSHRISDVGTSMILDETGQVLASSLDRDAKMVKEQKVANISPLIASGYELFQKNKQTYFIYYYEGVEYIASFSALEFFSGKKLINAIVMPASYFLKSVIDIQRDLYFIASAIIILGAILIFYFSRKISLPIVLLANSLNKIKKLELDEKIVLKSYIKEIVLISDTVIALKSALKSFKKYVPKEIVHYCLSKGKEIKLGSKKRDITIFFSDIYNFTTISEAYPIQIIDEQLAIFYEALSNIIIKEKGTIDKYIGDGIMAFWGAPDDLIDHTERALRATLNCNTVVHKLNNKWSALGKPQFVTRFGIHTDEVYVGNIGTNDRLNYTAMGDGVNLTSRLEGINKVYHTNIIVSESVVKKCSDKFLFRPLDFVQVKGKFDIVKIYELIAEFGQDISTFATVDQIKLSQLFTIGFDLYQIKDYKEAYKVFLEILTIYPNDYPSHLYIERIKDRINNLQESSGLDS
jgi:adenylate cyclase